MMDPSTCALEEYLDRNSGFTEQEAQDYYTDAAASYDMASVRWDYQGPARLAECVARHLGDHKDARILDVAAGTGLVGEQLHRLGFTQIDALDPNEAMLEIAERKGIYRRCIEGKLDGDCSLIKADAYDCVVSCGGFVSGHLPCSCLLDMVRITKPGGLVVNLLAEIYLTRVAEYRGRLEPFVSELESAGLWSRVERTSVVDYGKGVPGLLYVHRVLGEHAGTRTDFTSAVL